MPPYDSPRIQYGAAADLDLITEHRAELFQAGLDALPAVLDDDELLIRLYIGGDGACAHMCLVA